MALLKDEMEGFFNPSSVAVIGASTTPGSIGHEVLRSLLQYKGRVYPINPKATEVLGLRCYPSILDVPSSVDLVVFAVPSRIIPSLLEDCGKKGVRNAIIISGGFKEVGGEAEKLEASIVEVARRHGIRVIGPNCIGVYDSKSGLDTFFQSRERMTRPPPGKVAFITQSGTFGCAMIEWMAEAGLGMSKFVSYGNRSDVDEADLIDYLAADEDTKVIAIYTESIGDGRKLLRAAREALQKKPIVILKSGRTESGSRAALSHTGSLSGSYAVAKGAFRQAGLIQAQNLEELFDMTKALLMQPPAEGNSVAMITNGAGPVVMAVDACTGLGIETGRYSQQTVEELRKSLPYYCQIGAAVDLTGSATVQTYRTGMEMLLQDPNVDLLIVFIVFQDTPLQEEIVDTVHEMLRYKKPIICCAAGGEYTRKQVERLEKGGVPVYPTAERAVAAAQALIQYGLQQRKQERREETSVEALPRDLNSARQVMEEARKTGLRLLTEHESKEVLRAYGIPTTRERLTRSPEEAVSYAEQVGFPVVLKISSPDIAHKTEAGGVKVGLRTSQEVYEAFEEINANVKRYMPDARIQGILVYRMAPPGTEVVVGATRDQQFGPVVMFGLGGVFVEALKDVSFRLAPVSKREAMEMMSEVKGYAVLKGFRDRKPADLDTLADILVKASALATDLKEIRELDMNPVLAYEKGAMVVDARIVID
ncbi:MAG: acetate--CoA ligase family protein [Candidatus Bathyarchaeia archaeon]